jgi:hypothetical protein
VPVQRKRGPWKRRPAIDDLDIPRAKEKARPKPWREQLADETRAIDSLSYGDAWALLIKWRYVYDEGGAAMVDEALFAAIVKEAYDWQAINPGLRSDSVFERVRNALWTARARLEIPDFEPVAFG